MIRYLIPSVPDQGEDPSPASDAKWERSAADEPTATVEQHVETINSLNPRVFVAVSTIVGAGYGLFARTAISQGAVVCEYKGERLTRRRFKERYPRDDAQYSFALQRGFLPGTRVRLMPLAMPIPRERTDSRIVRRLRTASECTSWRCATSNLARRCCSIMVRGITGNIPVDHRLAPWLSSRRRQRRSSYRRSRERRIVPTRRTPRCRTRTSQRHRPGGFCTFL